MGRPLSPSHLDLRIPISMLLYLFVQQNNSDLNLKIDLFVPGSVCEYVCVFACVFVCVWLCARTDFAGPQLDIK